MLYILECYGTQMLYILEAQPPHGFGFYVPTNFWESNMATAQYCVAKY